MKRYAFIYNPAARRGRSKSDLEELEKRIEDIPQAKLIHSQTKGDIANTVEELKSHFDIFVACGGDGTVREVAANLISTKKCMGIIPMGTGNDLCKSLKIPRNIEKSFEILLSGNTIQMDIGRCNDYLFMNTLGFGFDGLTNRYALEIEKLPSFLRYVVAALKAAIKQDPFNIKINYGDHTINERLIMATLANGRVEGGSFWIAPQASITDGKLNLITIDPIRKWLIPILLPFFLIKKPNCIPHFQSDETEHIELELEDNVEIHADGEIIKTSKKVFSISMLPNSLEVISGV